MRTAASERAQWASPLILLSQYSNRSGLSILETEVTKQYSDLWRIWHFGHARSSRCLCHAGLFAFHVPQLGRILCCPGSVRRLSRKAETDEFTNALGECSPWEAHA